MANMTELPTLAWIVRDQEELEPKPFVVTAIEITVVESEQQSIIVKLRVEPDT